MSRFLFPCCNESGCYRLSSARCQYDETCLGLDAPLHATADHDHRTRFDLVTSGVFGDPALTFDDVIRGRAGWMHRRALAWLEPDDQRLEGLGVVKKIRAVSLRRKPDHIAQLQMAQRLTP